VRKVPSHLDSSTHGWSVWLDYKDQKALVQGLDRSVRKGIRSMKGRRLQHVFVAIRSSLEAAPLPGKSVRVSRRPRGTCPQSRMLSHAHRHFTLSVPTPHLDPALQLETSVHVGGSVATCRFTRNRGLKCNDESQYLISQQQVRRQCGGDAHF